MPRKKSKAKRIAVGDFETDPFEFGAKIEPFSFGFYDGETYEKYWGNDTCEKFVEFLGTLPDDVVVYFHNGGKFDFQFLLPWADDKLITIIGSRIVVIVINGVTLIDSMALMPFALDNYKKTKIDYNKFRKENRNRHKAEILSYQRDDCIDLWTLLTGFIDIVGRHLTIGGAAFANMRKLGIDIPKTGKFHDEKFRPFYYGGRTEAFKKGWFPKRKLKRLLYYVDLNSCYPRVMCEKHPCGEGYDFSTKLPKKKLEQSFVHVKCESRGAFPYRIPNGPKKNSLEFPTDKTIREYKVTGWEYVAAIELGLLKHVQILGIFTPHMTMTFKVYVDTFYPLRNDAKEAGDKIADLAYKYLLNSGYGKLATDPRRFKEFKLKEQGLYMADPWQQVEDLEIAPLTLWEAPSKNRFNGYFDVATGSSITGCARATLLRGLHTVDTPFYCDTDSIICFDYEGLDIGKKLGQWDIEKTISEIAICGKKTYAYKAGKEWHVRSKGMIASAEDVKKASRGQIITVKNSAPTFHFGQYDYIERTLQLT